MRSFLFGSLEWISSGNLAESSYSFCFTMNYPKIHRSRSTRVAALTALKINSTLKVSTFLSPLWIDGREKLRMLEPWVMDLDWLDLLPGKSALMLARGRRSPQGWSTPWRRLIKIPASPAMTFVPQYQDLMKFPEGLWMTSFSRTWAFLLVLLWRSLSWLHIKLLGDWRPWWHVVIVSIQLFSSHSLPILIDLLLRLHVELRDWSRCWVLGNYFFKNVRNIDSENQALKQGWKYGKKYEKWLNSSGDKKSFYSMFQRNLHF